jgi:spore germination protein
LRYRSLTAALGLMLGIAGCNSSGPDINLNPGTNPQGKAVMGYYTGDSDSYASATSSGTPVSMVSMDLVAVNSDGSLSGSPDSRVLAYDQSAKHASYVCISNYDSAGFDPVLAHDAMVTNEAATIKNITAMAVTAGLTGINIDFEGIDPTDRDAYSAFVSDLAVALHKVDSQLLLSVPAKNADDPGDTWSWPYDYGAIGQSADLIQVMTYDENVPGEPPGPVAGADWMKACLQYAISQMPADKLLLGLPAYGYDWDVTAGTGVAVEWKDMPALLASTQAVAQWDAVTDSAHIDYTDSNGHSHEVWYETALGIQIKSAFAVSLGLKGVSMWALGMEDASFWSAVEAGLQ